MAPQREWFEKDYYKVLGVSSTATDKEITKAYRKLAKQYHPDANPGSEDRFKEISAAYDVLGDGAKRKEYDEVRKLGPMAGGFGSPGGFGGAGTTGPGGTFRVEDLGDLGDLFGGLFGGGRPGRRRPRGPQRGADVETELHLSFADAVRGVTTTVNLPEDTRCHTCNGSGAAPGTSSHTCERCGGKGTLDDNQGMFSLSTICPRCNGRGTVVDTPCPTCHGTGTERRNRKVKVRIPPGVEDGQRIRVKGRGAPGQGMAPPGDLYVVVHAGKHERFGRRGRNLTLTVPVSFPEAALGTTITVPTLDDPVTLRVPAGTAPGTHLRVKGRGVPAGGGRNGGKPGDLLVRVDVTVPKTLTDEQRAAAEALAATLAPSDAPTEEPSEQAAST
ncbi:MAG TPA: molecular chaperone DnaJ [Acidimicrobiales bacterium]|nr:molecular chaperone DnaJ [Acidimicrobiales bacterium]